MYSKLYSILIGFLLVSSFFIPLYAQENDNDTTKDQNLRLNIIQLGDDARVILAPVCIKPIPGVWFVHVHEDENTAVQAAMEFIDSLGEGCFVTLKHGMGRNISFNMGNTRYTFDPNRIYTDSGRKASLLKFGTFSDSAFGVVSKLAKLLSLKFIDSNQLIVALHNNTDGGGLTIKTYQRDGAYANDASKVSVSKRQDEDDFFYTTSDRAFDFFRKRGFNVMLQNSETVTDDGSLSVYAGNRHIDYINIEAQHGKKEQQKRMLGAVLEYIQTYYLLHNPGNP
jgi:hypothetical protein